MWREPCYAGIFSEPGKLTFRVLTGVNFNGFNRLFPCCFPYQIAEQFTIAYRLQGIELPEWK